MRVYRFKADVAAAVVEYDRTVQLHDQLRRMLVIASRRHLSLPFMPSADLRLTRHAWPTQ
jgi:hypothetical protein